MKTLSQGDIVTIKPEFLNPSENPKDRYIIREFNGDRCIISPMVWHGKIIPTELVRTEMLLKVK